MSKNNILLISTKKGSGKSVVAIGTFLKLKENNHNPGYFKPIGDSSTITPKNLTDKDVSVISAVVARKFSKEQLCPQFLNPMFYLDEVLPKESPEILEKIKDAFDYISDHTDVIIIEGNHDYMQYSSIHLDDISIAQELDARVVICAPVEDDNDLNLILGAYNYCKLKNIPVIGVILSSNKESAENRIEKFYKPLLKTNGIAVLGGLKNSKALEMPTIAEIMDRIDGKMITGDYVKIKNNKVDGFIVGAMGASKAISYIEQGKNLCVITGGDRTDIALSAMETNIAMLVFTGNIRPTQNVIDLAQEKGIPLILASGDTFTITEKLQTIHSDIQPDEIELCYEQVDLNIQWEEFLK